MKNISLALLLAVQVIPLALPAAHAEGFRIRKDSLEQVDWFHGKRQAQIIDDDMEVRDLRRRPTSSPYVEIQLAPLEAAPGYVTKGAAGLDRESSIPAGGLRSGGPNSSAPPAWKTSLPESGFGQSYIPSRRMSLPNLQPGYNTGVHANLMRQPKSETSYPTRLANRGDYIKPPVKSYSNYNSPVTGTTQYNYRADVHGQIKRGSLIFSK